MGGGSRLSGRMDSVMDHYFMSRSGFQFKSLRGRREKEHREAGKRKSG